jgi:hypothetical protein
VKQVRYDTGEWYGGYIAGLGVGAGVMFLVLNNSDASRWLREWPIVIGAFFVVALVLGHYIASRAARRRRVADGNDPQRLLIQRND